MRQRNAYVLLGLPFGASREEANVAFARKARALRRAGPEGHEQLTDLTWALNQIDEALANPAAAMHIYRIPADPDAFTASGAGLFAPSPESLPAQPGDRAAAYAEVRAVAAHDYLRHLVGLRAQVTGLPNP
jgi:hypothetical protein